MDKKRLFDILCQESTLLKAWTVVKQKGAAGGVDGITITHFDENVGEYLKQLKQDLLAGQWNPEPYLRISIPKKENERRKLGLLSIKDKVVQQAIKQLIEPRFEKIFVSNSYAYRPEKGHTKAIRFTQACCRNKKYPFILRLDIDNFFDTIDHDILFRRIRPVVPDEELLRLIQLCVKMGVVSKKMKWEEVKEGVPQGAVLSPLLANYYLHSFDQFVLSHTKMYVRYADDFILCCESPAQAETLLKACSEFLTQRLKLRLNAPEITEIKNGFEFLGITLDNRKLSLSDKKKNDLHQRIRELSWEERNFTPKSLQALAGIHTYYGNLLPQNYLAEFDNVLLAHLQELIQTSWNHIPNKSVLQEALKNIRFFAPENILCKSQLKADLIATYLSMRTRKTRMENQEKNRKIIIQRKKEYRKKENEASELIINTYGTYIGVSNKGITVKVYGKQQPMPPTQNLQHITVLSNGVSLSSNAVDYCMQNQIGIDFFTSTGHHIGSLLSGHYMQSLLWEKQAMLPLAQKSKLAATLIYGKLKNQQNLIKYFHKYHKTTSETLCAKYKEIIPQLNALSKTCKQISASATVTDDYRTKLLSLEAQGAEAYWDYIRELISDDDVHFLRRERHGATDLVNCLLNYGYALLYARVWQALLYRKLNPAESVLHVRQPGKPTFVYDVVELFRTQTVDRIVITLVQKKEPLTVRKGLLDEATKKLLIGNILERINRYEKYRSKECRLSDIISLQAKEIAEFVEWGTSYKPYIAKW